MCGSGCDGVGQRGEGNGLLSLPGSGHGPGEAGAGHGVAVDWAQAQGLGMPIKNGLTIDVTRVPAFEAALQIVEFVRELEVERDLELCSGSGSAVTTPSPETASQWKPLRSRTGSIDEVLRQG